MGGAGAGGKAAGGAGAGGKAAGGAGAGGVATGGAGGVAAGGAGGVAAGGAGGVAAGGAGAGGVAAGGGGGVAAGGAGAGGVSAGGAGAGGGSAGMAGAAGAPGCAPNGSKCVTAGANNGLCVAMACSDCNDPADDGACTTAYGGPHLCLAGSCTPGDCRLTPDCAGAKAADVCVGNQCTACDAVGTTFFVDPINGDDTRATGSGTAAGSANAACAFQTVTAALKAIAMKGTASATTLDIIGPSTVGPNEAFPFAIPTNTTVTASVGPVTIDVPAGHTGFTMSAKKSKIDGAAAGLTVDGQMLPDPSAMARQHGLTVGPGADFSTIITNVTFTSFADEAIAIGGGGLAVGPGVTVTASGAPPQANGTGGRYAVAVGDGGQLGIDVVGSAAPTKITGNNGGGIVVNGQASMIANGNPGATLGTGTVVIDNNPGPGIFSNAGGPGGNGGTKLMGVVLYKNGTGIVPHSGARVALNTKFSMYGSVSLANGAAGVHVVGALPANGVGTFVQNIDLGSGNFGKNVLQDPTETNSGTGICLDFGASLVVSPQTLNAKGNIFGPNQDCSMTNATLTESSPALKSCGGGTMVGVIGALTDKIDVSMCTYP